MTEEMTAQINSRRDTKDYVKKIHRYLEVYWFPELRLERAAEKIIHRYLFQVDAGTLKVSQVREQIIKDYPEHSLVGSTVDWAVLNLWDTILMDCEVDCNSAHNKIIKLGMIEITQSAPQSKDNNMDRDSLEQLHEAQTYRELRDLLSSLSQEQLDCQITWHCVKDEEFYAVTTAVKLAPEDDVLDRNHPYLQVNEVSGGDSNGQ